MDISIRHDHRSKFQLHAEFLERDGHRGESLTWLDDGEGEFSTREEAGLFTVYGNQIWFGQYLQQVLLLQSFNDGADIEVGAGHEEIKEVGDRDRGGGTAGAGGAAAGAGGCRRPAHLDRA